MYDQIKNIRSYKNIFEDLVTTLARRLIVKHELDFLFSWTLFEKNVWSN